VFAVADAPGGQGDGDWSALAIRHRSDPRRGFVTELLGVPL
jgi:hypothetical protein